MKIVHVIDYFQPSLGYWEVFLARGQAREGHDVNVITSDRYPPGWNFAGGARPEAHAVGAGFSVEEGIRVWRLKARFRVRFQVWMSGLEEKIRELAPDLVIMHNIVGFSSIRIARLKRKTGNFRLIFDDSMTPDNSLSKWRILYYPFKWLFSGLVQKSADALVAILPATRVFMHEKYGLPLERITVIPLGADDELFKFDAAARQEVRDRMSIRHEDVVFIYTGKIVPIKALPTLIEATSCLVAGHDKIKVMLVGSGPPSYVEELRQEIKTKKVEERFVWQDTVPNEQLYKFYSAADAAVWPSGPSISMREAMACGLPIIIGKSAKVTELVEYGNGFLFQEGDAPDLARQMEKLLDSELRKQMGLRSRRLIADKFCYKIISRRFMELV